MFGQILYLSYKIFPSIDFYQVARNKKEKVKGKDVAVWRTSVEQKRLIKIIRENQLKQFHPLQMPV